MLLETIDELLGMAGPDAGPVVPAVPTAEALATRPTAREAELQARIEQLRAAQEALQTSYARSLAETIEAHEQRFREQEQAAQELRRLHACNALILDSAAEGIVGLDMDGKVIFVNPAAERMLGWRADELLGGRLHDRVHCMQRDGMPYPWEACPVRRTLVEGTTERVEHDVFWRKDGTSFAVEYIATPMREDSGIAGAVLTFQDITQRKMLECQLVQAQKLESIGQLAAGIAHEINTPTQFIGDNLRFLADTFSELTPLLVSARRLRAASDSSGSSRIPQNSGGNAAESAFREALNSGEFSYVQEVAAAAGKLDLEYLAEEIPQAISQSLEGVERVATIVRSMKEFSHPGSREMQPVDLNKALESTLTVSRNEWKYVAEAVKDFDPGLPPVTCLPGECNQVFLNLIINAAHAIAEKHKAGASDKGTITVRTRSAGEWVEIRVADTGTGIPESIRTKVFDPFFTTKEVGRGTGQGLAIARSVVVDKHGGTLALETEVGRGTTFIVRLPQRPQVNSKSQIPDSKQTPISKFQIADQ